MALFAKHKKLVVFTYSFLTVGMLAILFLFPDNNSKLVAIAVFPFIAWLPFDVVWFKDKRRKKRQDNPNLN